MLGQPLGVIKRAWTPGIVGVEVCELSRECRVRLGLFIGPLQMKNERHQRFGNESTAENAEMAALVRSGPIGIQSLRDVHRTLSQPARRCRGAQALRTAVTKAWMSAASFFPGARSTPDETSTPGAPATARASPT